MAKDRFQTQQQPLFVRIKKEQGRGDGMWQVLAFTDREYQLRSVDDNTRINLYIAHTYKDIHTVRRSIKEFMDRANKIGAKK